MGQCLSLLPAGYSTHKEVKLLDRKLGILYISCVLLVIAYVVGVRIVLEKGYNGQEQAYGTIGARINGTTYFRRGGVGGEVIPYDVAQLIQINEGAGDGIYVPTRILTTKEQTLNDKIMGKIGDRFGGGRKETTFM